MICPVKSCHMEIDDDSRFCDQCGAEILECPQCGTFGTGKFCPKDGIRLEPRKKSIHHENEFPAEEQVSLEQAPQSQTSAPEQVHAGTNVNTAPEPNPNVTMAFNPPGSHQAGELVIRHSTGFELQINHNDIIGRTTGPHCSRLNGFRFISREHAVFVIDSGKWCLSDLESTNRTKLNGQFLEAKMVYPVNKGDVIYFADQEFKVI